MTKRRKTSLATRIAVLSVGIVVITALVAGLLAAGLNRIDGANAGRKALQRLADVAQSVSVDRPAVQQQVSRALRQANVRTGTITSKGVLRTTSPLVRMSVTPGDIVAVRAGRGVSVVRFSGDQSVFVEIRPVSNGRALVLAQRRGDAAAAQDRATRRIEFALLIAALLAIAIGLIVAWRLARPLRRTAEAAHAIAAGNRDVVLPAHGPREVVEVSDAVNGIVGALRLSETRQRDFLLSVSHDLRTPLTAISGYAESLAHGVVPTEETGHVGTVMLGEAKRLERLVGDLLDLARLDAQDFRVEPATVDLVPVARAAVQVWTDRAAGSGIDVRLETPPYPVPARTDAARLRQALDGLFDNALRVTPGDRPIVLTVRAEAGTAVVEVRDGGPGLTDADLAVAFEQGALYERYRGVRQVGTGLGLAIVHRLVSRLGGVIEAGHAPEGGARFTVRLPAA